GSRRGPARPWSKAPVQLADHALRPRAAADAGPGEPPSGGLRRGRQRRAFGLRPAGPADRSLVEILEHTAGSRRPGVAALERDARGGAEPRAQAGIAETLERGLPRVEARGLGEHGHVVR